MIPAQIIPPAPSGVQFPNCTLTLLLAELPPQVAVSRTYENAFAPGAQLPAEHQALGFGPTDAVGTTVLFDCRKLTPIDATGRLDMPFLPAGVEIVSITA